MYESTSGQSELTVIYDPDVVIANLVAVLTRLETPLHGASVRDVIGSELPDRFHRGVQAISRRAATTFGATVVGEFKRGKSTLINALLGEALAPVDALPETATVNIFRWGREFSAELNLVDGGRVVLRREQLRRAELTPLLEAAPRAPVGVAVSAPLPILEKLVLVDTPGTGDLTQDARREVREHLASADLLIVVVSAVAPLSQDERNLLRATVRPHDFPKILFVLNMVDSVATAADVQRLVEHVGAQLGPEFPGSRVFPLSALDEFARRSGGARPRPADASRFETLFAAFSEELEAIIGSHGRAIRADRMATACLQLIDEVEGRIRLLARSLDQRGESLEEQVRRDRDEATRSDQEWEARKETARTQIAGMGAQAAEWMAALAERTVNTLCQQLPDLRRDDIERDLQFFMARTAESGVAACLRTHTEALTELSSGLVGDGPDFPAMLEDVGHTAGWSAYTGTQWTSSALVHLVADRALGLGLFVDIGAGLFGKLASPPDGDAFVPALKLRAPEVQRRFSEAARTVYAAAAGQLLERLEAAHAGARAAAIDARRQALDVQQRRAGDLESARHVIDDLRQTLDGARSEVQELKTRFRPQ